MFAVPENTIALPAKAGARHPAGIAADLAGEKCRWEHLLRFDPVERFVMLLEQTDEHEVWLLSWLPRQATDLHAHGSATGAFTVVSGVLTERVVRVNTTLELRPGYSRVFAPDYVHQVSNNGVEPAVSIHVYRRARRGS